MTFSFQHKKFAVFPYLVELNDNGSYDGLREPIRNLENHYPELKIYYIYIYIYTCNRVANAVETLLRRRYSEETVFNEE